MNRGPLILAIVLLLLPVLYVGSYLALLTKPGNRGLIRSGTMASRRYQREFHYRIPDSIGQRIYWPLEQIDRRNSSTTPDAQR